MCRASFIAAACAAALLSYDMLALADEPVSPEPGDAAAPPTTIAIEPGDASRASMDGSTSPVHSEDRTSTVIPKVAVPPALGPPAFAVDPIADGAIIIGAAGFAGILELINGTGEVRPQQISPTFARSQLLGIDRGAISQTVDGNARTFSNIGLFVAVGYAVLDPIFSGLREQNLQSGLVDAVIYAEAAAMTLGVTNLAKIAVRRPRPQAYIDAEAHKNDPSYSNSATDSSLSFFSGHSSMTASLSATATYLAFVRSPHGARPWITLGVGAALTSFVSVERVRGGAHFPTDVIAGTIAGAGIGILVAHLHRDEDPKQRRVWVGFSPERGGGGLQLGGVW
jgi:membrane-associated phospholipid phosphatase